MKKRTIVALLAISTMLWLFGLPRQTLADGPTVKVTQVDPKGFPRVVVYASVTDEAGKPVAALKQEDFDLKEGDDPVEIVDFAGIGSDRPVDIVFVFDTTTSMEEEVDGMKRTSLAFADKLHDNGIDYRLGLVDFGDVINRVEKSTGQLTDSKEEFKSWIDEIRLAGGGFEIPEFSLGALQRASEMSFRDNALKVLILITDAPPHHYGDFPDENVTFTDPALTLDDTLQRLGDTNVAVYVIAPPHSDYQEVVTSTNGEYFDIHGDSDFTTIIDKIGGLIASQYRITYESNRPAYDGTKRPVTVTVGGSTDSGVYTEEHMLNVKSSPIVAILLILPLLGILLLPTVWPRITHAKSAGAPPAPDYAGQPGYPGYTPYPPPGPVYHSPPPPPVVASGYPQPVPPDPPAARLASAPCTRCGRPVRVGAKFCTACGQPVAPAASAQPALPCARCGQPLRPGARFCPHCGAHSS